MYLSIKNSMLKVALFCMLPFLQCKQGSNFTAEETTGLLYRERNKLKGESFVPLPHASGFYKPHRDPF